MPDTGTGTQQTQAKNEVTFNVDDRGHIMGIINEPFRVSKTNDEHVNFFISDGNFDFMVKFDESPFHLPHFRKANHEGVIRPEVPGDRNKHYKYDVTILRADGTVADSQDPGGYVDP